MRVKTLIAFGLLVAVILSAVSIRPESAVYAEVLLQDAPRFDGKNIYFTESGDEASRFDRLDTGLSRLAGLLRQQGANLYTLEWRTGFPTDADLIVVAGPTRDLTPDQIARLWAYVNNNGRLLLLADPLVAPSRALPFNSGIFELMWADMGIRARNDVVVMEGELQAAPVSESTEEAPSSEAVPGLTRDFFTSNLDENHPITASLDDSMAFFTARSIEADAVIQDLVVTPLIMADSNFYGESAFTAYLEEGTFEYNIGRDTTRGPLPLAVALDDPNKNVRIVLIGDRQFATNGGGLQTSPPNSGSFLYPGNVRFLLNATAWLLYADAPERVEYPTPGPTATPTITPSPTPSPLPTAEGATPTPAA